jgi:hypothetical protein
VAQIFAGANIAFCAGRRRDIRRRTSIVALAAALLAGAPLAPQLAHSADRKKKPEIDYTIVPGERIGPITVKTSVREIVERLGTPDRVSRSRYRDELNDSDLITYWFKRHCMYVTWFDKGLWPKPESRPPVNPDTLPPWKDRNLPAPAIVVTCPKWKTKLGGVSVGSTTDQVAAGLGMPPDRVDNCKTDRRECIIIYKSGLWLWTRDRDRPVFQIGLVATEP